MKPHQDYAVGTRASINSTHASKKPHQDYAVGTSASTYSILLLRPFLMFLYLRYLPNCSILVTPVYLIATAKKQ